MPNTAVVKPQPGDEVTAPWGQSVADALNGIQGGTALITISASATGTVTVTFPRAFASAPVVVANHAGGGGTYFVNVGSITATNFVLTGAHRAGTATSVSLAATWIAMGPPA
jgi:hypothetical protein